MSQPEPSENASQDPSPLGDPSLPPGKLYALDHKHGGLGEFASTAICGNDISSSCLYVSAFAIATAGKLAPVALLIVAALLFLFRKIYAEVVGALPLNGGAYNALLNTTSKSRASVAACLTILSYMATAVISAGEAMHYGKNLWQDLPFMPATIALLACFTALTIMGISESSRVAIGIFVTHLTTLSVLLLVGIVYVLFLSSNGTQPFRANMASELTMAVEQTEDVTPPIVKKIRSSTTTGALETPDGHPIASETDGPRSGDKEDHGGVMIEIKKVGVATALFFGFSVALLGISGFESSANFVEEQAEGVFPKTLRNMWIAVSFFNPAMALLALALVPIATVQTDPVIKNSLLAHMGFVAGGGGGFGRLLSWLISVDAFLVLSGAVLTSFVGVNGLVRRMTLDRCLPQFLLKTNTRGTTHRILIMFFLLSVSVLLITEGRIEALAGVYTISFLTVMALFGIGNILLKVKRAKLPRPAKATWFSVIVAIMAVLIGLLGNAIKNPQYLKVFLYYFIPAMLVVSLMLYRIPILKMTLSVIRAVTASLVKPLTATSQYVRGKINEINSQQVVFFTRGDNIANLNNAMLYVSANEDTNRIKVVTVIGDGYQVPPKLSEDLRFLDEAYPDIDIEFVVLEDQFSPELIQRLSREWNVPTNLMFIGSPRGRMMYGLAELGGVRLII